MNTKTKAHLSVFAANLIFGVNFSIVKFITPHLIKSFGLNVARVLVTTALLWLMFLIKPSDPAIKKKDWWRFIVCAGSGVAINQMFFIKGVSLTYSIHASLLILITPILITVVAALMIKEKITFYKIIGLMLGITGAVLLIMSRDSTGSGSNILLGDLFIIINAVSYSFYLVLVRKLMNDYPPMHVIRWVFTLGTIMILPFGWNEFVSASWSNFNFIEWTAILFVVLGATFFAYLFNLYGIQHIGASKTGAYIYSQPVFAAIISAIFLNEPFTAVKIVAAVLIFAGVYLATLVKNQK